MFINEKQICARKMAPAKNIYKVTSLYRT